MTDLKTLLSLEPFADRLFLTDIYGASEKLAGLDCVLVATEDLAVYKKIKSILKDAPILIECPKTFFLKPTAKLPYKNVGAVMSGEKLSFLKSNTAFGANLKVALPTDFDFSELFLKKRYCLDENGFNESAEALPQTIVIPLDMSFYGRRGALADAFCSVAAGFYDLFDMRVKRLLNADSQSFLYEENIKIKEKAIDVLLNASVGKEAEAVFKAQLLLSEYDYKNSAYSDADIAAAIMGASGVAASAGERKFFAAKTLFKLAAAVMDSDIIYNDIYPAYTEKAQALSALFKSKADFFAEKFRPEEERKTFEVLQAFKSSAALKEAAINARETKERLERIYGAIYGGKKIRAKISYAQAARAVKLASVFSAGILKYIGDHGITDAL